MKYRHPRWLNYFGRVLLIALVLLGAPLSSSATPALSHLPSLKTDEEKLQFLLSIREKVPSLFAESATYDVNLFSILDDEKKLLELLSKNPEYAKAFENRPYFNITITPPKKGLELKDTRIKPEAIEAWKSSMSEHLAHLQQQVGSNPAQESKNKTETDSNTAVKPLVLEDLDENIRILNGQKTQELLTPLFQKLNTVSKNHEVLTQEIYPNKEKSLESALELMLQKLKENKLSFGEDQTIWEGKVRDLIPIARAERKVRDLTQLALALNSPGLQLPEHVSFAQAKDGIGRLSAGDLAPLADIEDGLKPQIEALLKKLKSQPLDSKQHLTDLTHKALTKYTSQSEAESVWAKDPVHLEEVTPSVGIFRGCTGGDCSSQFSFPYPNDPHERVFFISEKGPDSKLKLKGYVSATEVKSGGKKSLYVITIAGHRVNGSDSELILRGLDKAKAQLGVEQILLPTENNVNGLMNFPGPKSAYLNHVKGKPSSPVEYQSPAIRTEIENFTSLNNKGHYDHMTSNQAGVLLSLSKSATHDLDVQVDRVQPEQPKLSPLKVSEVVEFAADLQGSNRTEILKRVVDAAKLDEQKMRVFSTALSNPENHRIKDFEANVAKEFAQLGGDPSQLSHLDHLLRLGRLKAPDAFEVSHVEKSMEGLDEELKKSNSWQYSDILSNQAKNPNIKGTKGYQRIIKRLVNTLESPERWQANQALGQLVNLDKEDSPEGKAYIKKLISHLEPNNLSIIGTIYNKPWFQKLTEEKALLKAGVKALIEDPTLSITHLDKISYLILGHGQNASEWQPELAAFRKRIRLELGKEVLDPGENLYYLLLNNSLTEDWKEERELYKKHLINKLKTNTPGDTQVLSDLAYPLFGNPMTSNWTDVQQVYREKLRTALLPESNLASHQVMAFGSIFKDHGTKNWQEERELYRHHLKKSLQDENFNEIVGASNILLDAPYSATWKDERDLLRKKYTKIIQKGNFPDYHLNNIFKNLLSNPRTSDWAEERELLRKEIPVLLRKSSTKPAAFMPVFDQVLHSPQCQSWNQEHAMIREGIRTTLMKKDLSAYESGALALFVLKDPIATDWKEEHDLIRPHIGSHIASATPQDGVSIYIATSIADEPKHDSADPTRAPDHWKTERDLMQTKIHEELSQTTIEASRLSMLGMMVSAQDPIRWSKERAMLMDKARIILNKPQLSSTEISSLGGVFTCEKSEALPSDYALARKKVDEILSSVSKSQKLSESSEFQTVAPFLISVLSSPQAASWKNEQEFVKKAVNEFIENAAGDKVSSLTYVLMLDRNANHWREEAHRAILKSEKRRPSAIELAMMKPMLREPGNQYLIDALNISDLDARAAYIKQHAPKDPSPGNYAPALVNTVSEMNKKLEESTSKTCDHCVTLNSGASGTSKDSGDSNPPANLPAKKKPPVPVKPQHLRGQPNN